MNILLTNCWQAGNTGDMAIWKNLMKHLETAFGDVRFLIASQVLLEWDVNQLLEYDVEFYVNRLEDAVRNADVVISQGGGYMIGEDMVQFLKAFELAQSLNIPTFFSTQTIVGPISDETKELLAKVMNNAEVVSPRDQGTYDLLLDAGVDPEAMEIVPDTVFDIGIEQYSFPYKNSVKMAIRGYDMTAELIKEFALLADMITETMGQVVFIPVGHGGDRDDRSTARAIADQMQHESVVIEDRLTAEQLKACLRDGMLISDRYHGIIYAASMNTPFIALTPDIDSKMPGLMELLDYPITILNKKETTAKELFPQVMEIWKDRIKYREILKMKTLQIKRDSRKVYDKIIQGISLCKY